MKPLSSLLTESDNPETSSSSEFSSHYILRGVATAGYHDLTVYLPSPNAYENSPVQWWRLVYDTSKASVEIVKEVRVAGICNTIESTDVLTATQMVPQSYVLNAASKGLDRTLLVYANSQMIEPVAHTVLPAALRAFVGTDNATFRDEIQADRRPIEAMEGVMAHSERRGSSGSSTRVEISDDDMIMEENDAKARPLNAQVDTGSDGEAAGVQEMQEVRRDGSNPLIPLQDQGMEGNVG